MDSFVSQPNPSGIFTPTHSPPSKTSCQSNSFLDQNCSYTSTVFEAIDRSFVIAVTVVMVIIHIFRPDITNPITNFIAPFARLPSLGIIVTLSVIRNSIAAANQVRQGLLRAIMRGVHSLQYLPWERYYTRTANIFYSGREALAKLDAASSEAGYPWIGLGAYLAVCVAAVKSVIALIPAIRLLLNALDAIAVWLLGIVRNVCIRAILFIYRIYRIYRLVFGHPVMPNPVAVHQGAVPAHSNGVPVISTPIVFNQGALPVQANRVPETSNLVVVHQGASSASTRRQGSR